MDTCTSLVRSIAAVMMAAAAACRAPVLADPVGHSAESPQPSEMPPCPSDEPTCVEPQPTAAEPAAATVPRQSADSSSPTQDVQASTTPTVIDVAARPGDSDRFAFRRTMTFVDARRFLLVRLGQGAWRGDLDGTVEALAIDVGAVEDVAMYGEQVLAVDPREGHFGLVGIDLRSGRVGATFAAPKAAHNLGVVAARGHVVVAGASYDAPGQQFEAVALVWRGRGPSALRTGKFGWGVVVAAISPRGAVAVGTGPEVLVFDRNSRRPRCEFDTPGGQTRLAFVGETADIVQASDGSIARIDRHCAERWTESTDGLGAISVDGSALVTTFESGRGVRVHDLEDGRVLQQLRGPALPQGLYPTEVVVSPDGRHVLVAYHDFTVRLWSLPGSS